MHSTPRGQRENKVKPVHTPFYNTTRPKPVHTPFERENKVKGRQDNDNVSVHATARIERGAATCGSLQLGLPAAKVHCTPPPATVLKYESKAATPCAPGMGAAMGHLTTGAPKVHLPEWQNTIAPNPGPNGEGSPPPAGRAQSST